MLSDNVQTPRKVGPLLSLIASLAAREDGTSALEFALVAPVLIFMLIAISDVTPMLMARFKAANAAETTADAATSYSQLQTSDMNIVFSAASDTLAPMSAAGLITRITNVYSDGKGNAAVYWSCGQGALTPYAARSTVTTTPNGAPIGSLVWRFNNGGNNGTNTSFVMVETNYVFHPVFGIAVPSNVAINNVSYLFPRNAAYVGFPWDGVASHSPPAPASTTKTGSTTLANGAACSYAY